MRDTLVIENNCIFIINNFTSGGFFGCVFVLFIFVGRGIKGVI